MPTDFLNGWWEGPLARTDAAVASAARTTTATGTAFTTRDVLGLLATLDVTAASGTDETLDVALETSADDGATWYTAGAFPQQTAVTDPDPARVFGPLGEQCRWKWTIGGTDTPTFTFSVSVRENRDS